MKNTSAPSYLRLHRGEDSEANTRSPDPTTDLFWNAFSAATGWRVDRHHRGLDVPAGQAASTGPIESASPGFTRPSRSDVHNADGTKESSSGDTGQVDLVADGSGVGEPPVVKSEALQLASIAERMAEEIDRLRDRVAQQEASLAALESEPLPGSSARSVADGIHATLTQAIGAIGFDSAAIYTLDDDTRTLRARAVVGLPADRLTDSPRPLRGSRGDLEALVRDVVVMEDLATLDQGTWNTPEPATAAVCCAIYRGSLPIGTLWLFAQGKQRVQESAGRVAQLASSQISMHLNTAAQRRTERLGRSAVEAVGELAAWQYASLPVGHHLAPGWFADGMIESPRRWTTGWHHWDVLPDGSLAIATAEAKDGHVGGAMVAASAKAALLAHGGYRHGPRQILQRVGDTLWQCSAAEQVVSLLYAIVDPESGEGEVAAAGSLAALIAGPYGYRPLVRGSARELGSTIDVDCCEAAFQLGVGETLLAYGPGLQKDGISQALLGNRLRSSAKQTQHPLAALRRELAQFQHHHERGLVTLTRSAGAGQ